VHLPILKKVANKLESWGYNVCVVCLLDSLFATSPSRFISGTLTCLAAMMQLGLPHVNVLTKCDLLEDKKNVLNKLFDPPMHHLLKKLNQTTTGKFHRLNEALSELITSYSLTTYLPLDLTESESLEAVLSHVDNALQYGEAQEPKEPKDYYEEDSKS